MLSVRFAQPMKGMQFDAKKLGDQEDAACVGGMCELLGKLIRDLCWKFIDEQPGVVSECLGAIGQKRGRILEPC